MNTGLIRYVNSQTRIETEGHIPRALFYLAEQVPATIAGLYAISFSIALMNFV